MEKRVTIKDIAEKAGVSIGTVHCALNGKPGVGDDTRARVVETARQMGYRPNAVAASLKRGKLRIAASFPGASDESRFYYTFVWEAIRDLIRAVGDFNIELIEVPFYRGVNNQAYELNDLLDNTKVDGLLTTGETDARGVAAIQGFIRNGIPVILIGNDIPQSGRLCCVQPNYEIIGRTLAELLTRQIPGEGGILLCAGDVTVPSNYLIVQGFDAYLREHECKHTVYRVHSSGYPVGAIERFCREIKQREDLRACCAVNARASVALGSAIEKCEKSGSLMAVGSDLFAENVDFLRRGVFTNLLYKKPYSQAYTAARYLSDYLLQDDRPPQDLIYTSHEIVFQSSLSMYDNGRFRLLR